MVILKDDRSSLTLLCVYKINKPIYQKVYGFDCYKNELYWLRKLADTGFTPKVLSFDDKTRTIVTEYLGTPVNRHTLPPDWRRQRDQILEALKEKDCRHNDIKPGEILVHNGLLKLIDFGWASPASQPVPEDFPSQLGLEYRCPSGYDDMYSFNRVIASL